MIDVGLLKTPEDCLQFNLKALTEVLEHLNPNHGLKRVTDRKQAARHILRALGDIRAGSGIEDLEVIVDAVTEPEPTPEVIAAMQPAKRRKSGGKTYQDMLRETFATNERIDADELAQQMGTDLRNLSTAISILKNAKRTKDPFVIHYDRPTRTYYR